MARTVCETANVSRLWAHGTRWQARKERLRSTRARSRSQALRGEAHIRSALARVLYASRQGVVRPATLLEEITCAIIAADGGADSVVETLTELERRLTHDCGLTAAETRRVLR